MIENHKEEVRKAILRAANAVITKKMSTRAAAKLYGVHSHVAVHRMTKYLKEGREPPNGYKPVCKIFSTDQERMFCEYLQKATDSFFGFSTLNVRMFAYQLACKYELKVPVDWTESRC